MKSYKRFANESGINSVFAEYHSVLRKEYGIFGLDASYKSSSYSWNNVTQRLSYYGGSGEFVSIESLQLLTDYSGVAFYDQALLYMETKNVLGFASSLLEGSKEWEEIESSDNDLVEDSLVELEGFKDNVLEDTEEEDILSGFTSLDLNGILNLVIPSGKEISEKKVNSTSLPSGRSLNTGIGTGISLDYNSATGKVLFNEYILEKYSNAVDVLGAEPEEQEDTQEEGLSYEIEYIIGGKDSDKENLKSVVHKLLLIRTPINYTCLSKDSIRKAEVDIAAATIAVLIGAVGTETLIAEALLWAWSYGESMAEVKYLLSGGSVELIKDKKDWIMGLSSFLNLGSGSLPSSSDEENESGMSYKDYIRMLLFLQSTEKNIEGAIDMTELGIRTKYNEENFRMDYCISSVNLTVKPDVGMGFSYEFPLQYRYR